MANIKSTLKKFSLLRDIKVLSDVTLSVDSKSLKNDFLLVGPFGVMVVVSYNEKGEIYGNRNDESFVLLDRKMNRIKIPNLVKEAEDRVLTIREIFSKEKIYNLKIYPAVVLGNALCQSVITNESVPMMSVPQLKKYLNCGKFDDDNKVDVQNILNVFEKYRIK